MGISKLYDCDVAGIQLPDALSIQGYSSHESLCSTSRPERMIFVSIHKFVIPAIMINYRNVGVPRQPSTAKHCEVTTGFLPRVLSGCVQDITKNSPCSSKLVLSIIVFIIMNMKLSTLCFSLVAFSASAADDGVRCCIFVLCDLVIRLLCGSSIM